MQAKVIPDHRWATVRACGGKEFIKSEWRPVPEGLEEEAATNPLLVVQDENEVDFEEEDEVVRKPPAAKRTAVEKSKPAPAQRPARSVASALPKSLGRKGSDDSDSGPEEVE